MQYGELIFTGVAADGHSVNLLETVGTESRVHRISVDPLSYKGIETALATHPFPKKKGKDVVRFESMSMQEGCAERYLSFYIANSGSRHRLRVEISTATYEKLNEILQAWIERKKKAEQGA